MHAPYNRCLSQDLTNNCAGSADDLAGFIATHPRLFVITGAGISHASGIPTYRDEVGSWKSRTPIQHGEFIASEAVRQRYWARSFAGWPHVAQARPNAAHQALAQLEGNGYGQVLVTQNIDRLHQRAGQRRAVDLHGRLDQVLCLDCGALSAREDLQHWLQAHNPHLQSVQGALAPDGDAEVARELINDLRVPTCSRCDGTLMPNVVFYGGSVGRELVHMLVTELEQTDAVLVVGTSLMVFSGYRFCRHASARGIPIACVNQGLTRADELFTLKVSEDCGPVLASVAEQLTGRAG